ncbi:MAG: alkaline phosphatase D family protein [Saprospiraceae bacterium]|nr:alkaline phosphatase D family protein [Saprospiraceae bacterium]MBK7737368.1 alkaline phosphatase D family protein [Saprospiraceae bacterium]MBK7914052.1 alkaline phosphatase D family protein [Saprospiraceae bacterium]
MKIAFTSCINITQYPNQPWWKDIEEQDPDYLFLLGDNIYMDYPLLKEPFKYELKLMSAINYQSKMENHYENQFKESSFKSLFDKLNQENRLFGIWDDHDFLWNNSRGLTLLASKDSLKYEIKEKIDISRRLFHQYFKNCSSNLPELYYLIDTPLARVIFLDARSYSEKAGVNSLLLGNTQFEYLEKSLNHDRKYTIICSGQTLTEKRERDQIVSKENWSGYPMELVKLCRMIKDMSNVIFLSGDIHKNKFVAPVTLSDIKRIVKPGNVSDKEFKTLKTPIQFISSGFALSMKGVLKNWAMLNIDDEGLSINYFKKHSKDKLKTTLDIDTTNQASKWLQENKF